MKFNIKLFTVLVFSIILSYSFGQKSNWNNKFLAEKPFIENKGQFDLRNWQKNSDIKYAIDNNNFCVFFTDKGLTYRFDKFVKNKQRNDIHESKRINISELVSATWLNSNNNVKIVPFDKSKTYYSYDIKDKLTKNDININNINGYNKLKYNNIYNNVDIDYESNPNKGIKYTIYLHPGADLSKIALKYSSNHTNIKNENIKYFLNSEGNLQIKTSLGEITELKPYAYYSDNNQEVETSFKFENNILTFNVKDYDNTRELIIDPWVISASFNSSNAVWEVETDGSGNVYVIGGETPMKLQKFNSGGTSQWIYTSPWDTAGYWLGTLATDNAGNSFITAGTSPEIKKIDNSGSQVWTNTGFNPSCEYWSITFNCDKTKLIVGGTYVASIMSFDYYAAIYDIDINNGNVLGYVTMEMVNIMGIGNMPIEVRSISSSKNAKYIYLTHQHVGAINQNISTCPNDEPVFEIDNGHHLGYKCENYLPASQNGGGLKAIVANDQFFYTHTGDQIHKWNLSTGAYISSATIPGGANTNSLGIVVKNSGLAVDNCGNVYAGSINNIIKYDANLNLLSQIAVGFTVYDVSVNSNAEVIAVGAQFDNSSNSRNGQIQSVNLTACAQYSLICCDANICNAGPFCTTDAAVNLISATVGGVWTGTGITNSTTGTFNPATAGIGTHYIVYTLSCGSDSIPITVSACAPIDVCYDGTNLIASGGSGTISWEEQTTVNTTPANQTECEACGGSWFFGICSVPFCTSTAWTSYTTGLTASQPATWPLLITDGVDSVIYNSLAAVPNCNPCTPPTLSNVITNVTCAGGSNGAINLTVTGSSTYTYSWTGPLGYTSTTQDPSGLSAGSYNVTVTDASNSACTATATITINPGAANPTPTIAGSTTFCTGGSSILDAGSYNSYLWSDNSTNQTLTVNTAGTYSVTVTNSSGCTGTASVTVSVSSSLSPVIAGNDFCAGNNSILDAGTGFTSYSWSTIASTQTITVNTAGTYTVTVTDGTGCSGSGSITINENPLPNVNAGLDITICTGNSTTLTGTGALIYNWDNGLGAGSSHSVSPITTTTYYVTGTDVNGCINTDQVIVTVTSNLTPTISGSTTFCSGGSTILDAGVGYNQYLWSTTSTSQTITVTNAGLYSVTVTNLNGCTGTASVDVTVSSSLSPTIIGNDFCTGSSSVLDAGSGFLTYNWSQSGTTQTITVNTPNTYIVTVTDATGCSGTGQIVITENTLPIADAGTDQTICVGASANLTATGGSTYTWSNAAITASTNVSPISTTTYTVTVTDINSCSATDSVIVNVISNLTSDFTATQILCAGGTSTVTYTGNCTGNCTFNWSFNGGTANPGIGPGPHTVSWLSTGSNSISLIVSLNGCSSPVTTHTINNPTQLSASATTIDAICYGQLSGSIDLTVSGGTPPYQFLWNNIASTEDLSNVGANDYTVLIADSNGCTISLAATVNQPTELTIYTNPTVSICNGEWAYLTATATGGSPQYSYFWNNLPSNSSIAVNPTSQTNYSVYVTDSHGCTSNSATVSVNVSPPLQINVTASPNSICPGDTVNLNVDIVQGGGPPFMIYNSNGEILVPPIFITPTTSGIIYLYVKDGCGSIASDSVNLTVNSIPNASFVSDSTSGCQPLVISFNPTASQPGETYLWDFGDASYNTISFQMNPVHEFTSSGTFDISLTVTSPNGCKNTNVHNQMITVYPRPFARFIANPSSASIIKPQIIFTNLSELATFYIWTFGDGDSSSVTNPMHWYSSLGNYVVQLIAISDKGCSDTARSSVLIRDEYTFYAPTAISPDFDNINDVFYVLGNGISTKSFHLYIYDRWGEIIYETTNYDTEHPYKYGWDGSVKGGAIAPVGSYTWLVKYFDGDHVEHVKSGVVNVIR